MKVIKIEPQGFASNSYILTADDKTAIVIDPSEKRIEWILKEKGLKCRYALLTHGHYDHIGGCGQLYADGVCVCCGQPESDLIYDDVYGEVFGGISIPSFNIYKTFRDGDILEGCGITVKVIATPGHTAGSVCYMVDDCIFTGDTLMCDSVGRTDLPTGNWAELEKSVKKLYSLEGDYKIYCGHGPDTTLGNERLFNPFIRGEKC